jgi:hypothetical protein
MAKKTPNEYFEAEHSEGDCIQLAAGAVLWLGEEMQKYPGPSDPDLVIKGSVVVKLVMLSVELANYLVVRRDAERKSAKAIRDLDVPELICHLKEALTSYKAREFYEACGHVSEFIERLETKKKVKK